MLIALDYDGTFTEDPALWLGFIQSARTAGHTVICVTLRTPSEARDMDKRLVEAVEVVCTSRSAKVPHMEALGRSPDVWIDDEPQWLLSDVC